MASLLDYVLQQHAPSAGLLGDPHDPAVRLAQSTKAAPPGVASSVSPASPRPAPAAPPAESGPGFFDKIGQALLGVAGGKEGIGTSALLALAGGPAALPVALMAGQRMGGVVRARDEAQARQEAMEQSLGEGAAAVLSGLPEDQREAVGALLPGLPVAARQEILAGLALRQRDDTMQKLSPGEVIAVQTPDGWQTVYQAPADGDPELDAMQLGVLGMMGVSGVKTQEDLAALDPNTRAQFAFLWDQIRRSTATQVNLGDKQADAEMRALVGLNADLFQEAQETGRSAMDKLNTINQVESLLESTRVGKAEEATFGLRQLGSAFGLDEEQVSQQQALRAFENRFALQARQNMPGQLSDNDIKFLKDSVIGLGKTKAANILLAAAARRIAEAQVAYQAEANRYVTQNGLMGLAQHMARYSAQHQIKFDDLVAQVSVNSARNGGSGDPFSDLGGR